MTGLSIGRAMSLVDMLSLPAKSQKQELMDRRLQYAIAIESTREKQQKSKVYTLSPRRLLTYTNAFMHVYCRRFPSSGFYVRNEYFMPRYWTMIERCNATLQVMVVATQQGTKRATSN